MVCKMYGETLVMRDKSELLNLIFEKRFLKTESLMTVVVNDFLRYFGLFPGPISSLAPADQ